MSEVMRGISPYLAVLALLVAAVQCWRVSEIQEELLEHQHAIDQSADDSELKQLEYRIEAIEARLRMNR